MKIIFSIIAVLLLLCSALKISAQKEIRYLTKIVNCDACNKTAISLPKPEYPKAAIVANASGTVSVRILIDEKGNVGLAEAVSGHHLLRAESVKAALKAKFKPLLLSGKPVKVHAEIVYNFVSNKQIQPGQIKEKLQQLETPKEGKVIDSDGRILIGKAIKLVKPPYVSCNCRFGKISSISSVVVQAKIDEQGNVIKATAVSGHLVLKLAGERAARKSKFFPTMISGISVKSKTLIIYRFISADKWSAKLVNIIVKNIQAENQSN